MVNIQHPRTQKFFLIISTFLILTLACSLPGLGGEPSGSSISRNQGETKENAVSDGSSPTGENGGPRCERMGYPCSFAAAPKERVDRSLEIMDLADEVFSEEGSAIAVAERLSQEEDLAEMIYDERGVWYRMDGAPPMIFLHPEAFPSDRSQENTFHGEPTRGTKALLSPYLPEPDGPIGTNPPGEKARKQALFVVPLAWEYGADIHGGVETLLRETRDYQCPECVELQAGQVDASGQAGPEAPTAGPSIEQFQGWESYDLIHVYAHGYQFCPGQSVTTSGQPVVSGDREDIPENTAGVFEDTEVEQGECVTIIQTGHYQTREHLRENPRETSGIAWTHKPGSEVWAEVVTTDFFQEQYPQGLDDTVIYLSSCQTMRDRSLADALLGTNSAVLGWSDSVFSRRGEATAVKFFQELVGNGLRATVAHQKAQDSSSHTDHSEDWFGAQLEIATSEEGDPRGREVVTLVHPATREELKDDQFTVTYGLPEDGEQDDLYVAVRVDGVDSEQTPEDFVIHIRVNGEELNQTFTASSDLKVGEYSYLAQGSVQLPYDVTNTEQVKLEAWAELPENGDTRHVLDGVRPVGCGWEGSLSGVVSGEYEGLIMDMQALLDSIDSGAFNDMLGSMNMAGVPSTGDVNSPVGKTWVITFHPQEMMVGSLMTELGIGTISNVTGIQEGVLGYNTEALNYQQSVVNDHQTTGSFSGSYYGLQLVDNKVQRTTGPTFQGEFTYHDQALCNVDIIMTINKNYAEGMAIFR